MLSDWIGEKPTVDELLAIIAKKKNELKLYRGMVEEIQYDILEFENDIKELEKLQTP